MKRFAIIAVMLLTSLAAMSRDVHYFTHSQASRTVKCLNSQNELMIWCGYDYEVETYVLVNEVWMERVNSAYYEIWLFGWDAYTGDEVYMPIDLQCIWLISGTRVYNAAQYLRFRVSVSQPHFSWHIPAYNPYRRTTHSMGYQRSYHYNVHRHGWMPPAYTQGMTTPPLPPYYMRHRNQPAPMPTTRWTPGVERPTVRSTTPSAGAYTPVAPSSRSASSNANRNANQVTPTTPTSRSATGANSATSGKSENASTPTTTPTSRSANSNKTVSTSRSANSGNTTTQPSTPTSRSANSTRTVNTSRNTTTPTPSATTTPTSRSANNKSVERKVENSKQEVKKENVPAAAPASRSAKTTRR